MNVMESGMSVAPRTVTGNDLLSRELLRQKVDTLFFLMGGPMTVAGSIFRDNGIRMIDARHEQAAAFMAQAYARVSGRPGVCMACSGPGTMNLTTGLANAFVDGAPVVALGGSSPVAQFKMQAFQEIDQVAVMRPITKWAERVYDVSRIPEYVDMAFKHAMSGKPGPVYLDLPGDILFHKVSEADTYPPRLRQDRTIGKAAASEDMVERIVSLLGAAQRPIVLSGSGVLWSGASEALQRFVEKTGIPFYTSPQGRGAIAEDHEYAFLNARSTALREADLVLVVGTRLNYMLGFGMPPRMNDDAIIVQIDADPEELSRSANLHYGVVGDAALVLDQLSAAADGDLRARFEEWRGRLAEADEAGRRKQQPFLASEQTPIHPLRLCKEVADFMDRDAILVVDGQEILTYGRQSIPTFVPAHRLNSGPFGTMGIGLPFGIGAKAAKPDKQVIVLHGDGSFGINAMELDASVRHRLPVIVVISLNGGWTADPDGKKAGSRLGLTRYDRMAETLGCHGEYVERPEDIRPALERAASAVKSGRTAVVNVVTDPKAQADTAKFAFYRT